MSGQRVWVVEYHAYGDRAVVFVASTEERAREFATSGSRLLSQHHIEDFVIDEAP